MSSSGGRSAQPACAEPAAPNTPLDRVVDQVQEIINARVWIGYHYRDSVVTGVALGRKVAHWALEHYFEPED